MTQGYKSRVLRVLIVDDSAVVRSFLRDIIDDEPDMVVVGEAQNGEETLQMVASLKPDLITMDVSMPRMDGVAATREIMASHATPIVIVTSKPVGDGSSVTFEAVAAGAVEVLAKPSRAEFEGDLRLRDHFVRQLRNAGFVRVVSIRRRANAGATAPGAPQSDSPPVSESPSEQTQRRALIPEHAQVIAIGASTGGPPAVRSVISLLDPVKSPPVLLVQHMSSEFVGGFVRWLDGVSPIRVQMAEAGQKLEPGHLYVAPGDRHLAVDARGRSTLRDTAPVQFQKPAADVLFSSVAEHIGSAAVGVLLTGMGRDGADGLLEMSKAGGATLAQDESSCLVYGMPKAAVDLGAAQLATSPTHIARMIRRIEYRSK